MQTESAKTILNGRRRFIGGCCQINVLGSSSNACVAKAIYGRTLNTRVDVVSDEKLSPPQHRDDVITSATTLVSFDGPYSDVILAPTQPGTRVDVVFRHPRNVTVTGDESAKTVDQKFREGCYGTDGVCRRLPLSEGFIGCWVRRHLDDVGLR